jgi:transposase
VSGDGDIPLFLRVADGNENDRAMFGKIAKEYKSMVNFETMIVGDSALYTENNLKLMTGIEWLSRVPLSIKEAKTLVSELSSLDFTASSLEGYSWYEVSNNYAGIEQRWLVVESQKRKVSDLEKLRQKIEKEKDKASEKLRQLMKQEFTSSEGAMEIANQFAQTLKYHQMTEIKISKGQSSSKKKKSKKKENQSETIYQITTFLELNHQKINELKKRAGRFVLATNRLNKNQFTSDDILTKYKEQQAPERSFGFLKDPLFFADSVFLKSPERIETMALLMGLCLLVYSLGQRQLRISLKEAKTGLKNQLGKLTERPTLRWIFQCFQGIHLVILQGIKQVVNLTASRRLTLNFLPASCQNYYILSG